MAGKRGYITVRCLSPRREGNFEIVVLDADDQTVFQGKTDWDGTAAFHVYSPGEHRIRVRAKDWLSPMAATKWLFFYPDRFYTVYFLFNFFLLKPGFTMATFRLTDQNYGGLPIQKGDIQLCRVPM